jgi:flagellar biogenesis protein FliO
MNKLIFAFGLMFACCLLPGLAWGQEESAPSDDPIIRSINAELDRGVDAPDRPGSVFADRDRGAASALNSLLRGIAALCIVLALVLGLYYAMRRWGKGVPILAGPNLGKVLGRVYLDKGTALHFVRVADRVLVVGVNGNTVATIAEFSASTFESVDAAPAPQPPDAAQFNPDSFLAELQQRSREIKETAGLPRTEEDEIAALRGDIQRLQRFLRDENREQEG